MVSPHCDITESHYYYYYYKRQKEKDLGKKKRNWKRELRTEKEKRKSLQIYRDELFQFPSLCFGLLCSFIGTTKPGMSEWIKSWREGCIIWPLIEIGLTDPSKYGGAYAPPACPHGSGIPEASKLLFPFQTKQCALCTWHAQWGELNSEGLFL